MGEWVGSLETPSKIAIYVDAISSIQHVVFGPADILSKSLLSTNVWLPSPKEMLKEPYKTYPLMGRKLK